MLGISILIIIILGGLGAYHILTEKLTFKKEKVIINKEKNNYDETYEYFMKLTLNEQHQYIKENYYLSEYSYEFLYNNKEDTAHSVAMRAQYMNTTFNDKVIKYIKY